MLFSSSGAYHPRHRAISRRRVGVWSMLLAVLVALVLSGPAGPTAPAYAATDQPTVSFTGSGLAPLACSSQPSVPNMTIKRNTRIVLANFTGADATVDLGSGQTVAVADGGAISVKLKEGSYAITMSPSCLKTFDVEPTLITVVRALPEPPSSPSLPAGTESVPPGSSSGSSSDSAGSSGTSVPAGTSVDPAGTADLSDPSDPSPGQGPDVEQASARRPDPRPDARGARLLALIAAICVFGVTSAIIRAIVAQRATGATVI